MNSTDEAQRAIVDRVAREAATWFPDLPPGPSVHLRPLSVRRRSSVYAVSLGEPTAVPVLVAKVRSPHSATGGGRGGPSRPTLAPHSVDEETLTEREYAGLELLASTFTGNDPRFGAIRPLAHLAEHHAILMDFATGSTMKDLVVRASRLHPARLHPTRRGDGGPDPELLLPHVGAWLRRFHEAAPTAGYPARQATGRDVVGHFSALEEFLARRLGRRFGQLAGAGSALAAEVFPSGTLPMAVGHGDFAPRNVLVDGSGRLVVFDPLMRWAVPVHEDLCRFLVGIRLLGLQLHSHGAAFSPAQLERWEELVIAGYGEDRMPAAQLRCYQLLILLDKWSALVEPASAGGAAARLRRVSQQVATRYPREQAQRLLDLARSGGG